MPCLPSLTAALAMLNRPQLTKRIRRSPLPEGVTFLLEVAAAEPEALLQASALTGRTDATLKEAAGFFIEQVLLSRHGDHYRTLGGTRSTPHNELRRNMALMMRWLHPDVLANAQDAQNLDKRVYVNRVTEAWGAIKTDERRTAYDAEIARGKKHKELRAIPGLKEMLNEPALGVMTTSVRRQAHRQLVDHPDKRDGIWRRFLLALGGHI